MALTVMKKMKQENIKNGCEEAGQREPFWGQDIWKEFEK